MKSIWLGLGVGVSFVLLGCSAADTEESVSSTESAITAPGVSGPTFIQVGRSASYATLQAQSTGFCFFSRIQGGFRGGGELMELRIVNGSWQIGGQSAQTATGASAMCVRWDQFGADGRFSTVEIKNFGDTSQGDFASNTFCYLAGVTGEFNGGGESVTLQANSENVVAFHQSGTGTAGKMACVHLRNANNQPVNLVHGALIPTITQATGCNINLACPIQDVNVPNATPGRALICPIDRWAGRPRGGGESVEAIQRSVSSWTIEVKSAQGDTGGIGTGTDCLYYQ